MIFWDSLGKTNFVSRELILKKCINHVFLRRIVQRLTGVCSAAMTVAGVTGAALAGACVDVTKQFSSTAKICFSATALGTIIFCIVREISESVLATASMYLMTNHVYA